MSANCHPERQAKARGLCRPCYMKFWRNEDRALVSMVSEHDKKNPRRRKKLPRGLPFQKGQSGNPNGRPKGRRNSSLVALEAELAQEPIKPVRSMSDYIIDLNRNVVNGKRVMPRVAELTYAIIQAGGWLRTNDLISKLFGLSEPQNALKTLNGWCYQARKVGIPIRGSKGRWADGYYLADERLWT